MSNLSDFLGGGGGLGIGQIVMSSPSANYEGFLKMDDSTILSSAYPEFKQWVDSFGFSGFNVITETMSAPTTETLYSAVFANGVYIAVGYLGSAFRSTDGINWTSISAGASSTSGYIGTVIHDGTRFIIAPDASELHYSQDGVNWTQVNQSFSINDTHALTYGGGIYVVYANSDIFINTTTDLDNNNWTMVLENIESEILKYLNGVFISGGRDGELYTSTDGTNWTARDSKTTTTILSCAYGNGVYVLGGQAGYIATSPDAITWTVRENDLTTEDIAALIHDGTKFIASVKSGELYISLDGIKWGGFSIQQQYTGNDFALDDAGNVVMVGSNGSIDLIGFPNDQLKLPSAQSAVYSGFIRAEV